MKTNAGKAQTTEDGIRIVVRLVVPPADAWSLLTERAHMAQWWGDHVTLEARLGGRLIENWSDGQRQIVTSGKVTRCHWPSVLEMTWADDDWPGDTKVTFRLSPADSGTRLVLEHSGWDLHPEGKRRSLVAAHADGWVRNMEALVDHASKTASQQT